MEATIKDGAVEAAPYIVEQLPEYSEMVYRFMILSIRQTRQAAVFSWPNPDATVSDAMNYAARIDRDLQRFMRISRG